MTIQFIIGDDWEGVYFEQDLVLEGHSIDAYELAQQMAKHYLPQCPYEVFPSKFVEREEVWEKHGWHCPPRASDWSDEDFV